MKPEQYEALGFAKFNDEVDGTTDYMYEYNIARGHQLYTDWHSDNTGGKLKLFYEESELKGLSELEVKQLINLLTKGLR